MYGSVGDHGVCVRVHVCVCVRKRTVNESVGELIADDRILYRQSAVMLSSLLQLSLC